MNTVEVVLTCHFLSEQQKDLLKVFGFVPEGQHVYTKTYEVNEVLHAMQLFHHILKEINIDPYSVKFNKKYFENNLDKIDNVVYNYV